MVFNVMYRRLAFTRFNAVQICLKTAGQGIVVGGH